MSVLQVRVEIVPNPIIANALCAGYELGEWCARQLVEDVFDRHLRLFVFEGVDRLGLSVCSGWVGGRVVAPGRG